MTHKWLKVTLKILNLVIGYSSLVSVFYIISVCLVALGIIRLWKGNLGSLYGWLIPVYIM